MQPMADKTYHKVVPGGLFHTHKVKYSPETEQFLRELIKESRLSMFQRKKVEESVKNGEPLPLPPTKTARGLCQKSKSLQGIHAKNDIPRRRKKEDILKTGAYEREAFTPSYVKANHDVEKAKLQEVMAFGRTLKSGKHRNAPLSLQFQDKDDTQSLEIKIKKKSPLDELADDIDERKQFLAKMEEVGRGKLYREIITQEIEEKLRLADNIFTKMDKEKKKS